MLAERMPDNVLLVIAERDGQARSPRRWTSSARTRSTGATGARSSTCPGLHFEACYYQAIEFCIERGIALFEGGAQGEHKHARGFLPEATRSFHWLAHPAFERAIDDYLAREGAHISGYIDELNDAHALQEIELGVRAQGRASCPIRRDRLGSDPIHFQAAANSFQCGACCSASQARKSATSCS